MTTWSETNGCDCPGCGDGGGGTDCECLCNPMTTPGDMIVGGTAGTPQRLAIGTNGQIQKVVGGVPTWSDPSGIGLPAGTTNYTLRYSGTAWVAASNLLNDGTHIGIGMAPSGNFVLEVKDAAGGFTGVDAARFVTDGGAGIVCQPSSLPGGSGTRLGAIGFGASIPSVVGGGSGIKGFSTEAWSGSARGGGLVLLVTPNTTVGNYTEALRCNHDGKVAVGNPSGGAVLSDPTSYLTVGGAISTPVVAKSGNYTATVGDSTIAVDASGGAKTITLPDATTCAGRTYRIQKTDSSGNAVTIACSGGQTVGGASTKSLGSQNLWAEVQSNGTNWLYFLGAAG